MLSFLLIVNTTVEFSVFHISFVSLSFVLVLRRLDHILYSKGFPFVFTGVCLSLYLFCLFVFC